MIRALAVLLCAAAAWAQEDGPPIALIADRVAVDSETERLRAEGDVRVFYAGTELRAAAIVYDARAERIAVTGPLVLVDDRGAVLRAEAADLSPDLQNGLIRAARILLDDRLQIAAAEIRRTGGRYTALANTVASTCQVCADSPVPLWAIRAERVIRDEVAGRIYFENARFEVFGIPLAYIPRLSTADPTRGRATGVLVPEVLDSDLFGYGLKVPYYIVLGPSADLTLTPFYTTRGGFVLETEYRQRLARGGFDLSGSVALDDRLDDQEFRLFLEGEGAYALTPRARLTVDLNFTTDESFAREFDISEADRLTTEVAVTRISEDSLMRVSATAFQTLRSDENNRTVPLAAPEFQARRVVRTAGGRFGIGADGLVLTRQEGADVYRAGVTGDWHAALTFGPGFRVEAEAQIRADATLVRNDDGASDRSTARLLPAGAVTLSWPLARAAGGSVTHVLEPVVQLAFAGENDPDQPNEDSQLVEFNETNLLTLSRFPGVDLVEEGFRVNYGLTYRRLDPTGWEVSATMGQILRFAEADEFDGLPGLSGGRSDAVVAVSVERPPSILFVNRLLIDNQGRASSLESELDLDFDRWGLSGTYSDLSADRLSGTTEDRSEVALDGRLRLAPNVEVNLSGRRDLEAGQWVSAEAGLVFRNECIVVDLSARRRFTQAADVPASTTYGFSVQLAGFGGPTGPARRCGG